MAKKKLNKKAKTRIFLFFIINKELIAIPAPSAAVSQPYDAYGSPI